jgi:membrane-associated protease RseP (regulator of RpoE activity)
MVAMNIRAAMRVCVGAGLLALSGLAAAQEKEDAEIEGSLDQPLGGVVQGTSVIHIIETESGRRYEVEVRDGRVTAKVDGQRVPSRRIKREGDTIRILDEKGEVIKEFHVAEMKVEPRARMRAFEFGPGGQRRTLDPLPIPDLMVEQPETPRVMLGIRMDESEDGAVVLADVVENLPAAKAGLRAGDELVSIDGKAIEKPSDVRDAIKEKNPGDKVAIVVRRDGEEKTFEVALEAWNQKALMRGQEEQWTDFREALGAAGADTRRLAEEARRALEKAMKEIQESKARDQFKKSWSEAMKQAIEALEKTRQDANRWFQGFTPDNFRGGRLFTPGDQRTLFVTPPESGQRGNLSRRLEELAQRLDEIDERLREIAGTLERLEQKKP